MLDPEKAIDRIRAAIDPPAGYRTLHAKGRFYAGTFRATPEATALCRAGHFQGDPVPVLVRWSNGSGNAKAGDHKPDVRGLSVSFKLPDGGSTDLLGQTAPRFPVRTPDDFVALLEAGRKRARLPLFLARRPGAVAALVANARAKALAPPFSYAEATYYPIHAYRWLAAAGAGVWVRYTFLPLATPADRPEGTFEGKERLQVEMAARLADGPVRYELRVQVAGPRDDPHDPMSVWKGARELLAGQLEVTRTEPDPEADGSVVVFDPTRIVDGIELSDDPILRYRAAAYSASVSRRLRRTPPHH
jgi:catalase